MLLKTPPGDPVKDLQSPVPDAIRARFGVLAAADNLKEVSDAHPEYRVHRWKDSKPRWSVDITGNTRLLFNSDRKAKEISDMIYFDFH